MKIVKYLEETFTRIREKVMVAWSRLRGQDSEILDRLKQTVAGFLTSPLSDTEYALLKRVSGIVGTAVAVYSYPRRRAEHGTNGTRPLSVLFGGPA